jgi:hypothetical protein
MPYYPDTDKVSLKDVQKRIEVSDLVPSRSSLLSDIGGKFNALNAAGFKTLATLRKELKNAKNIPALAKKARIDKSYLTLLRREIESWFPKPFPLGAFNSFPEKQIGILVANGLRNSALFYDATDSARKRAAIARKTGINKEVIDSLYAQVALTRIQWVSPLAACMLIGAGYGSASKVAGADPDKMFDRLDRANKQNKYFKGTIGLRDVKRLVKAAAYVR